MYAFLPGKFLWIGVAFAHCQKTVNAAVNHAVYGSDGIKGHALDVIYICLSWNRLKGETIRVIAVPQRNILQNTS